jgi:Icc-related predicted phosphoesterase
MSDKIRRSDQEVIRLLHVSDTHSMHNQIEASYPFPEADILIHTGDLTNRGSMEEFHSVNEWLGRIRHRFKHILIIAGNHDVHGNNGETDLKAVLGNATVLHHEVADEVLKEFGLRVYGSPWCAWKPAVDPGGHGHLFNKIPDVIDVLMTHGPPEDIFDTAGYEMRGSKIKLYPWGSSSDLSDAIKRAKPLAHMFGHLHEQRGVYQRDQAGHFIGGVEYEVKPGQPFPTTAAPPKDWPCDLISCNAMCNHSGHESAVSGTATDRHIAGPARLILAKRTGEHEQWQFTAS